MIKNKKAADYSMAFFSAIVIIIVFLSASIALYSKINGVSKTLGDTQYKLLNTYDNAEKVNFYIDNSARMSGYNTINYLSENGGLDPEECGTYFGTTLLTSQEKNCIPEEGDISPYFEKQFDLIFNGYLSQYPNYQLSGKFEYYIINDVIRGISDEKVILPIDGNKIEDTKKQEDILVENTDTKQGANKIVALAKTQIGKDYVFGAKPKISDTNPVSFDCSGFTRWVYGQFGVTLDGFSGSQYDYMKKTNAFISLEKGYNTPGALLYRPPGYNGQTTGHVAISVGDGKSTIEAMGTKYGVKEGGLFLSSGKPRFTAAALVSGIDYNIEKLNTSSQIDSEEKENNAKKTAVIGEYLDINELSKVISGKAFDYYPETGKTLAQVSNDYLANIRGKNYDEIIIMPGVYDLDNNIAAEAIEDNLGTIFSDASAAKIKVIALTLPPYSKYSDKIKTVNDWIKSKPDGVYASIDITAVLSDGNKLKQDYGTESPYSINQNGKQTIAKAVYDGAYSPDALKKVEQSATPANLATSSVAGISSCQNYDANKISSTNLKNCARYADIFNKYIAENKLNIDPMLIMSLVYQESGCLNSDELRSKKGDSIADRGIMQVDDACGKQKKCPDVDSQIKEGMKVFKQKYDDVSKQGKSLSDNDKLILTLYSYNRGGISSVLKYYQQGGTTLDNAMIKGCFDNFRTDLPDGAANARYDSRHVDKCTGPGYGVNYPKKILNIYNNACSQMDGSVATGTYNPSSTAQTYNSIGEYSFTPAFEENFGFDLNIYSRIYATLKKLNEMYDLSTDKTEFVLNISRYAKQVEPSLNWTENIDDIDKRVFYSFAEQYYLCADSVQNDCYCEIRFPSALPKESVFGMKYRAGHASIISGEDSEAIPHATMAFDPDGFFNLDTFSEKNSLRLKLTKTDASKYDLEVAPVSDDLNQPLQNSYSPIDYVNFDFSAPFYLHKKGEQIAFMRNYKEQAQKITKDQVCKVVHDTIRLGVETKKSIPVFDESSNSVLYKNQTIKFAYYFRDIIPPPLVYDLLDISEKFSDKSVILSWKHDDIDQDTSKFIVFYSKDNINGETFKSLEDMASSGNIEKKEFIIDDIEVLKSVDLKNPKVEFLGFAKTSYNAVNDDDTPISLTVAQNTLYYLSENYEDYDEYFVKVVLKDKGDYDFAVASVDKAGNAKLIDENTHESPNLFISIKDSLPPATYPLSGFDFGNPEIQGNQLFVTWVAPSKNIDGSDFNPGSELGGYYIYYGETLTKDNFESSPRKTIQKEFYNNKDDQIIFDPKKGVCYYVVPFDTSGNIQFNENTKDWMSDASFFKPKCVAQVK